MPRVVILVVLVNVIVVVLTGVRCLIAHESFATNVAVVRRTVVAHVGASIFHLLVLLIIVAIILIAVVLLLLIPRHLVAVVIVICVVALVVIVLALSVILLLVVLLLIASHLLLLQGSSLLGRQRGNLALFLLFRLRILLVGLLELLIEFVFSALEQLLFDELLLLQEVEKMR